MINICGTDLNTGIRPDQERITVTALGASVGKRICIKPTAERRQLYTAAYLRVTESFSERQISPKAPCPWEECGCVFSPVLPSETDEGVTAGERRRAAPTLGEAVWEETAENRV